MGIIVVVERDPFPLLPFTANDACTLSAKVRCLRPAMAVSVGAALRPLKEDMPYPEEEGMRAVRLMPLAFTPTTGAHAALSEKTLTGP